MELAKIRRDDPKGEGTRPRLIFSTTDLIHPFAASACSMNRAASFGPVPVSSCLKKT
jgi:hypothetical protein